MLWNTQRRQSKKTVTVFGILGDTPPTLRSLNLKWQNNFYVMHAFKWTPEPSC